MKNKISQMKIKVPTSWEDVTLKTFDELIEISNNENFTDVEREIRITAALLGVDIPTLMGISSTDYYDITSKLNFLNETPKKIMPADKITLNGKQYKVDLYPAHWSAAQFLDFKIINQQEIMDKKTARMIACFMYPIDSQYNDGSYDNDEVVNEINDYLSVRMALGMCDFFMLQYQAYAESILLYSKRKAQKSKVLSKEQKKELLKSLDSGLNIIKHSGRQG